MRTAYTDLDSGVDDQEDHDYQDEEQNQNGADLAHVVGLEQFAELVLHEVELGGGLVDLLIEVPDQNALLVDLLADLLALDFQSASYFVDLVEMLVLLLDEVVLHPLHADLFIH